MLTTPVDALIVKSAASVPLIVYVTLPIGVAPLKFGITLVYALFSLTFAFEIASMVNVTDSITSNIVTVHDSVSKFPSSSVAEILTSYTLSVFASSGFSKFLATILTRPVDSLIVKADASAPPKV